MVTPPGETPSSSEASRLKGESVLSFPSPACVRKGATHPLFFHDRKMRIFLVYFLGPKLDGHAHPDASHFFNIFVFIIKLFGQKKFAAKVRFSASQNRNVGKNHTTGLPSKTENSG
jgi:hypothetical protein